MENTRLYQDIAKRTDGDIYVGVVGPVRTGKSTSVVWHFFNKNILWKSWNQGLNFCQFFISFLLTCVSLCDIITKKRNEGIYVFTKDFW